MAGTGSGRRGRSARPAASSWRTFRRRPGKPVEHVDEAVFTVDQVSRRYNVTPRTVTRWRRQGLVARRFVIGGRTKVGFLESSLQRFVTAHQGQVERGSRFRQLTEAERDEIIRRARRMALVRPGQSGLVEIARRIARKMSRSTETVRLTLRAYDRDHPDRAIFPAAAPSLDDDAKAQIYRRFRLGVSAEVLARQYGRTRSSIYRLINEVRAERILSTKLELIDHASFSDPAAAAVILAPMPEPADGKAPRRPKAPKGLPPYLGSLYEVPLLDREQEMHLFRKMNYLQTSGARDPPEDRPQPGQDRRTWTRSSGFRKRRSPSRTRSSGPTCGWSSRSQSGTSGPRTTSSSWSPTATCR